jgi:hypothetical protein
VRHFRNIFFALAAFLWLPASAHCELASIDGFTFLACSSDVNYSGKPCSDSNQCGCFAVEKSQYNSNSGQFRVVLPSPDLLPSSFIPVVVIEKSLPAEVSIGVLTATPPQFLQTWQFASRTALPARAPSFVS